AVDPDHQLALRILGLALTDRFESFSGALFGEAQAVFGRLRDPYEHAFYAGLVYERQGEGRDGAGPPGARLLRGARLRAAGEGAARRAPPRGLDPGAVRPGADALRRGREAPAPRGRQPPPRPDKRGG